MPRITRRRFIHESSAVAAAGVAANQLVTPSVASAAEPLASAESMPFASQWTKCHDRVWLGLEYWANPLQDWRVAGGRIECTNAALDRNVHLLTRDLGAHDGTLSMSVRLGRVATGAFAAGSGSAGFRIGIQGPLKEYRHNLLYGEGLDAGLTTGGILFIGSAATSKAIELPADASAIELRLTCERSAGGYLVALEAVDAQSRKSLGQISRAGVAPEQLVGNVALVANFPAARGGATKRRQKAATAAADPSAGAGRFWFADWRVEGTKVEAHDDRSFGPILFNQYTLSFGVLKMTAQMPPIGQDDSQTVRLEIQNVDAGAWKTVAEADIHSQARTTTFRIENWDADREVPYRLAYTETTAYGAAQDHYWTGTIRRDPVDQPIISVADISCNIHSAFPNAGYVANVAKLNPDLIAFVGDQFYESTGGYGVLRTPLEPAIIDYLRKWYIHGWTWREVTRDRPSISIPDDHDVYQGNIWGEAGAAREGTQEMGGYDMHPEWVNVVHRTQASHHPDPYDPTPALQNISVYYGPLTYGRISFAILADRMFKTGPEGIVPPTGNRGDHVVDPNFDPKTADIAGCELLGERQIKFLRDWAADWKGAEMKAVLSQTIFAAMATTHGGGRERLRADYDTNGWPQSARSAALREIRKCFAVHLAGDQHLPAVIQYGVDEHGDAGVAFAGPAVNVGYTRWWEPAEPGKNRKPGAPEITGDFLDHFGNAMTVLAVANGVTEPGRGTLLETVNEKASGLGFVRFDKANRKITIECWPYLADPTKEGTQFPGWPVTVSMLDNYGRKAKAHLPMLRIHGVEQPVVQVVDDADGEIVYTLRLAAREFQPMVFAEGSYTVRVSDGETSRATEFRGLAAVRNNTEVIDVQV